MRFAAPMLTKRSTASSVSLDSRIAGCLPLRRHIGVSLIVCRLLAQGTPLLVYSSTGDVASGWRINRWRINRWRINRWRIIRRGTWQAPRGPDRTGARRVMARGVAFLAGDGA